MLTECKRYGMKPVCAGSEQECRQLSPGVSTTSDLYEFLGRKESPSGYISDYEKRSSGSEFPMEGWADISSYWDYGTCAYSAGLGKTELISRTKL